MTDRLDLYSDFSVSRETYQALQSFRELVVKWNRAINLVSKSTIDSLWSRHIIDSAQLFPLAQPGAQHWVDVGCGGGFPGIVVAVIAKEMRPALRFTLVEADQRKAAFLREACRTLGLGAVVLSERIEDIAPLRADVLSARALAPLYGLMEIASVHLSLEGTCLFLKGSQFEAEVEAAQRDWVFDITAIPSLTGIESAVLQVQRIKHV
jgi:16S rRNA (guanine527-N7)-methyltransferase